MSVKNQGEGYGARRAESDVLKTYGAANPRPLISYVGWHGRGNLGDDAIYDVVRWQLPSASFLSVPVLPHEKFFASARGLNRSLRRSAQLVGGGTLLGRRPWRLLVDRGLQLTKNNGSYAVGVGVEDPVFVGRGSCSENDELKQWAPILSQFQSLSVRGPRSAELLADIGLEVKVVGDPALLLRRPDVSAEEGLIGVNLGFGNDLWGHDPEALAEELRGAVNVLSAQGYRFIGILMNRDDKRWTSQALRDSAAEIVFPADAESAAREFARCSAAVVSRLHAGILASLSDTPLVSLEYQPKCRDFALSIDDERSLLRTDQVSAAAVVDRVGAAIADSPTIRTKTHSAVDRLRESIEAEYSALRAQLDRVFAEI